MDAREPPRSLPPLARGVLLALLWSLRAAPARADLRYDAEQILSHWSAAGGQVAVGS